MKNKKRQIISIVIVTILVLAMVVPVVVSALSIQVCRSREDKGKLKKNIGNITAAMAVFMAVAGFGIGSRAGSFEVRAEKQEAKADDKKSTDSDAKEEETTKEQESTQEAVTRFIKSKELRRKYEFLSLCTLWKDCFSSS